MARKQLPTSTGGGRTSSRRPVQWAEAIRERLRAIARELEQRGVLDPRPGRTAAELSREAGAQLPALAEDLRNAASIFDRVWYGGRTATAADEELLRRLDSRVAGSHRGLLSAIWWQAGDDHAGAPRLRCNPQRSQRRSDDPAALAAQSGVGRRRGCRRHRRRHRGAGFGNARRRARPALVHRPRQSCDRGVARATRRARHDRNRCGDR